jgi:hypothetical protein
MEERHLLYLTQLVVLKISLQQVHPELLDLVLQTQEVLSLARLKVPWANVLCQMVLGLEQHGEVVLREAMGGGISSFL